MIKILKATQSTWQLAPTQDQKTSYWTIAHKTNNQNEKQCLLVEIIPFTAVECDLSPNRILH